MCGIAGIIVKNNNEWNAFEKIIQMSNAIRHRGPDGEGFLLVSHNHCTPLFGELGHQNTSKLLPYSPQQHISNIPKPEKIDVILAHRRLSIIDLSAGGHQPLCDVDQKYWITYNGELYNYLELKNELIAKGHQFQSETDTEVVIAAYAEWGIDCANKFNGMWAFCLYDKQKQICFMSRDRLGVKPFYYLVNNHCFAFASEQKAFVKAGLLTAKPSQKAVGDYLLHELIENNPENFFEGVHELWPGHHMVYHLNSHKFQCNEYYHISNQSSHTNNGLSDVELIEKIEKLLLQAVSLRLRSDVEVGTCLSGGIDSSVIAALMAKLGNRKVHCYTSVFSDNAINEEHFADLVSKKIPSVHLKIEPTLHGFLQEVDDLIYSQDAPIWNTSTYAQYKVMALAKSDGIKVVLDGQGADELFAGYHHHFLAKWNSLFSAAQYSEALKDMSQSDKTIAHPFLFYLKEKIKQKYSLKNKANSQILSSDFLAHGTPAHTQNLSDVNSALLDDIYQTRLKTFLKCEDRCGMWHSVESRTPFSDDVDLINFMFSFNGQRKIQKGISKYLLREATKAYLPNEIYQRYDKVGFETPMHDWMKKIHQQMLEEIKLADFNFVNKKEIQLSNPNNVYQNKLLFKLFVLSKWQKVFT